MPEPFSMLIFSKETNRKSCSSETILPASLKFVDNEQKETLREGLISLIYRIKPNMKIIVRVDPHSSFKGLKSDNTLADYDIKLDIGDEKTRIKMELQKKPSKSSMRKL